MLTLLDVMNMRRAKDVDGLIRALQHQGDLAVRAEAAQSLGQLGDLQAVEPLISTLESDADPYVRSLAATALGQLGDARAEGTLADASQSDTLEVGLAASKALAKLSR